MKLRQSLLAANTVVAMALGLAVTSQTASARVVCNDQGDCWQTNEVLRYPRDIRVHYYSDRYVDEAYRNRHWRRMHRNWHADHHEHDHGAWRNGVWITF